jgi:hypothetical protein
VPVWRGPPRGRHCPFSLESSIPLLARRPTGLLAALAATDTPPWRYLARATLIAWIPAQAISFTLHFTCPGVAGFSLLHPTLATLLTGLVFGPCLETCMMRFIFYALGQASRNEALVNLCSSAIWGALHLHSESWGFHAVWSFWVMGLCYQRLARVSTRRAVLMTTGIHIGFNSLSGVLTWLLSW